MPTAKIITLLEKEVKQLFSKDSSGHDIYHLRRTLNIALTLQKEEGGDKLIIAVSAFLHDVHRVLQKETGNYCSPKDSLPHITKMLDKTVLTSEQKEKILHCIEFHEEYDFTEKGKTKQDIETLIVQDADNLEALGAIGIARTFSFWGAYGDPMWNPEIALDDEAYKNEKNDPSVIHHFYKKLLKLKWNMNTQTAKHMAEERHKFMETFLQEFFNEREWKK